MFNRLEKFENIEPEPRIEKPEMDFSADLIKFQKEIIEESEENPEDWIGENSEEFRKIAPEILKKHGGNKKSAKQEIKELLKKRKETIH